MKTLTSDNVNKCVSLLKEFIDEAQGVGLNKGNARLALDQLQNITAGIKKAKSSDTIMPSVETDVYCFSRPRAETTPVTGTLPG